MHHTHTYIIFFLNHCILVIINTVCLQYFRNGSDMFCVLVFELVYVVTGLDLIGQAWFCYADLATRAVSVKGCRM